MSLSGNLSILTFPDLLHWIGATAVSGKLRVRGGDREVSFWFRNGRLRSLQSSHEDDRFGQRLIRDGFLDEELLQELLGDVPLGKRLVDESFLSEHEVAQLLRRHALETTTPLLSWSEGSFEFEKSPTPSTGVPIPLSAEEMLLEGHRRMDELNKPAVA